MTTHREARIAWLGAVLLGSSCAAMRPPADSSGPATSHEGVRLTLVEQSCTQTKDPDDSANDLVEIQTALQVQNPGRDPLTVHRDLFALATEGAEGLRGKGWGSAAPLAVSAGQSSGFKLRFSAKGLSCSKQMVLHSDSAIEMSSGPIAIPDIRFLPSRSE